MVGVLFSPPRPSRLARESPAGGLVSGSSVHVPSQPLLSLALHKVILEVAQGIAIISWWPRRGWFPLVLQVLVDLPVLLLEVNGLLVGLDGVCHPNLHKLCLGAWRLSRDLSAGEAF